MQINKVRIEREVIRSTDPRGLERIKRGILETILNLTKTFPQRKFEVKVVSIVNSTKRIAETSPNSFNRERGSTF